MVFVDGVGLAPAGRGNPLTAAATPTLRRLLGGPLTAERAAGGASSAAAGATEAGGTVALAALDASLEVEGLPQSATGQTTLFTGVNAAAAVGRHVSAFPGPRLRQLIRRHGLLGRLRAAGHRVTFANAYSRRYLMDLEAGEARRSVTTCLVQFAGPAAAEGSPGGRSAGADGAAAGSRGAGEPGFRDEADLVAGRAVSWDITRELFARRTGAAVGTVAPVAAGAHLAAVAGRHRFTLFETFLTDLAGHGRVALTPAEAIARVDGLLGGLLAAAPPDLTLLVTSDHGNIEDAATRLHTRNPVPLLAAGPAAPRFAGLRSLLEVTPAVLACLGVES